MNRPTTTNSLSLLSCSFLAWVALFPLAIDAQALPPQEIFIRVSETEEGSPKALEVAVADYKWKDGKTVSLVSAVHVADLEYFQLLNKLLATYDIVLYELVAPAGMKPNPNVKRRGFFNLLQEAFADLLGASLQLEEVDYSSDTFVHADLSFDDLIEIGKQRGETLFSFLAKVIADLFAAQEELHNVPFQPQTGAEMMAVYLDKIKRRIFIAQTLAYLSKESRMVGMETLEPYILDARNEKVVEVLKEQESKEDAKTIAIFYGAAHMPDMEERIVNELQVERINTEWLAAWGLLAEHQGSSPNNRPLTARNISLSQQEAE